MRIVRPAVALAITCLLAPLAPTTASAAPRATTLDAAAPSSVTPPDTSPYESYVISVYEDLFDRAPELVAEDSWAMSLYRGTPRIAVANTITSSDEFRSDLITDAYDSFLGRAPDAGGLAYWLHAMKWGLTIEQLDAGFITSDEYWAAAGGTSAGWVRALYADVLDRVPSPPEVAYWTGRVGSGASRVQVAMGFLLSTEYLSGAVEGYYQWLLHRTPDAGGQAWWVAAIQHGARDEEIIGGILASDEYWARESSRPLVGYVDPSPRDATIVLGSGQTYTLTAYTGAGALIGEVTDHYQVTWDGQPCDGMTCTPTTVGTHAVHLVHRGLSNDATLTVVAAP